MKLLFVTSEWPFVNQPFRAPFVKVLCEEIKKQEPETTVYPFNIQRSIGRVLKARKEIKNQIEQNKIDHIHIYGLNSIVLIPFKYFSKASISLIGSDVYGVVKKNGQYSRWSQLLFRYYKRHLKKFRSIRTVSPKLQEIVQLYARENQIFTLSDGMEFNNFPILDKWELRKSLSFKSDTKYILFPSVSKRGVKNLQLAHNIIKKTQELASVNVELVIAPFIPHAQMNSYYRAVDLVIITSIHEGSPNVVKESLYCGVPVFSSDVGDVSVHVGDTKLGAVFNPKDDISSLANMLMKLVETEFSCEQKEASRMYCIEQFDVKKMVTRFLKRIMEEGDYRSS